jgi:hypothetical protein
VIATELIDSHVRDAPSTAFQSDAMPQSAELAAVVVIACCAAPLDPPVAPFDAVAPSVAFRHTHTPIPNCPVPAVLATDTVNVVDDAATAVHNIATVWPVPPESTVCRAV